MVTSYKELIVWKKGIELVTEIYKYTRQFPKEELYGLAAQMRRAAISIPSNIAEGQQRKNTKEFLQFLRISYGSAAELETQLIISINLYPGLNSEGLADAIWEIQKMLYAIIRKLDTSHSTL